MKFAATILYEDQYAAGATEFSLHTLMVRLVADEIDAELHICKPALDGRPMKGVDNVLNALLLKAERFAPNGRQLIGCVDEDRLGHALSLRKIPSLADVPAASTLPAKVRLIGLAHNTEALLQSVASLTATSLGAAVTAKERTDRDLVLRRMIGAQPSLRAEFRKRHPGVNDLVLELAPLVRRFLRR